MRINRRQFACFSAAGLGSSLVAGAPEVHAVAYPSEDVAQHVEAFRQAMINADPVALLTLTDDNLSFGHSNGLVQSKQEFVDSVVSRTEIFRSIELTDRYNHTDGEVAIERHVFTADILLKGEPLYVTLSILEVWRRAGGGWRLIARQAFKV